MSDLSGGASNAIGSGVSYFQQKDALQQQQNAANQNSIMNAMLASDSLKSLKPYTEMGTQGISDYQNFMKDPSAYMKSPAYQWQQQQIDKNMNRQLAAKGRDNSSYGMNSLANAYGELGTREYQNAYARMWDPIHQGFSAVGAANGVRAGQVAQDNYNNDNTQQNIYNRGQLDSQFTQGIANGNQQFNNTLLQGAGQVAKIGGSLYGMGGMGGK